MFDIYIVKPFWLLSPSTSFSNNISPCFPPPERLKTLIHSAIRVISFSEDGARGRFGIYVTVRYYYATIRRYPTTALLDSKTLPLIYIYRERNVAKTRSKSLDQKKQKWQISMYTSIGIHT